MKTSYTCKFYHKAEDASPTSTIVLTGTEQEVNAEAHEICDDCGYEAFNLTPQKRVWAEDEIKRLVQTNDTMLYRSLLKLYSEQTADEQAQGETRERNNRGFNGTDAHILSNIAEFLKRTGFLTDKQKVLVRRKLVKYNRQLTRLANA